MQTGTKKAISWFVLACGGIGSVLLVWMLVTAGWRYPGGLARVLWPLLSLAAIVLPLLLLRGLYRESPRQLGGRWQLSLIDLIAASLATGLLIGLWEAVLPGDLTTRSIPAGILSGFIFLGGLLVAARVGFRSGPWKYAFAIGHTLRLIGFLGSALFVFFAVFVPLNSPSEMKEFLTDVFVRNHSGPQFLVWPMRIGLASIVPGLLLCHFALRHAPAAAKKLPPAEPSDASKDVSA